jgi:predicted metal-dependent enzyme (double-stranded beta helix superfamily)
LFVCLIVCAQAIKLAEHIAQQERAQTELMTIVNNTAERANELDKKIEKLLSMTVNNAEAITALARSNGGNASSGTVPEIGRV